MELISQKTFDLSRDLYERMTSLRHPNGQRLAEVYSWSDFSDRSKQVELCKQDVTC